MPDDVDGPEDLPSTAGDLAPAYPDVWNRYADLGRACSEAGPGDDETKRLVTLSLAVGAGSGGALHSHTRRALEEDISPGTLRRVAPLAIPTVSPRCGRDELDRRPPRRVAVRWRT